MEFGIEMTLKQVHDHPAAAVSSGRGIVRHFYQGSGKPL